MHCIEVDSAALHAAHGRFNWLPMGFISLFDFPAGPNDDLIPEVKRSFNDASTDHTATKFRWAGTGSIDVKGTGNMHDRALVG